MFGIPTFYLGFMIFYVLANLAIFFFTKKYDPKAFEEISKIQSHKVR